MEDISKIIKTTFLMNGFDDTEIERLTILFMNYYYEGYRNVNLDLEKFNGLLTQYKAVLDIFERTRRISSNTDIIYTFAVITGIMIAKIRNSDEIFSENVNSAMLLEIRKKLAVLVKLRILPEDFIRAIISGVKLTPTGLMDKHTSSTASAFYKGA